MTATQLSPDDMAMAIALLNERKEGERKKTDWQKRLHQKIVGLYKSLNVPQGDLVRFVKLHTKYTLIHSEVIEIYLSESFDDPSFATHYSTDVGRISGYENDELVDQEDKSSRFDIDEEARKRVWGKDVAVHIFYANSIHKCPFCGESRHSKISRESEDEGKCWFNRIDYALRYSRFGLDGKMWPARSDFKKLPFMLRRCYAHEKSSRVDFLLCKGEWASPDEKAKRKSLYLKIYPEPLKHSKEYHAEKRVKKVIRSRALTKSEQEFFSMILGASRIAQIIKN